MFCLRGVDHGESFIELLQIVGGLLSGRLHRLAQAVGHDVEPRMHGALQIGLLAMQHLAHRAHAAGGFGLQRGQFDHARGARGFRLPPASLRRADGGNAVTSATIRKIAPPNSRAAMGGEAADNNHGVIRASRAASDAMSIRPFYPDSDRDANEQGTSLPFPIPVFRAWEKALN